MSDSDDDWMAQMRAPMTSGGGTGQNAMMEARRRALQEQREARQQQQQQQRAVEAAPLPTASGRGGGQAVSAPHTNAKKESDLPDFLTDMDDATPSPTVTSHSAAQPTQVFPSASPVAGVSVSSPQALAAAPVSTHEASVEELQRQIAAKQKLLQSTKDREAALAEKWRATKAQKQAEVEQLNHKMRRVWAALEDEKSAAETAARDAQDRQEAELRAARRTVEQEVKAEYDAKLSEAQARLSALQAEEARLRQLLGEEGSTSGSNASAAASAAAVVNTALTAAVTAVMHRLDRVFEAEESEGGLRLAAWKSELQSLVQREIQTSFAVGVQSETQAERDEYDRFFTEMLAFWRTAEEQERERLLKLDEALVSDLQSMAQQDLKRLQEEEVGMERVYVESREAWAMEHQKLLQQELEASLQRREAELQEQRRQRHELHVERLRDLESRHKDWMSREEALHQKQQEQLRAYFQREEDLQQQQQRVEAATHDNVAQSTGVLRSVLATIEETAGTLRSYEETVDAARRRLEVDRENSFKEHEELLGRLQSLAATQCSNTDAERHALEECASQLRLTSQNMERHLQEESAWLVQRESACQRNAEEWAREYRRWQQLVQQERQVAEERFHEALSTLQESMMLLETEQRDISVEKSMLHRTFQEMEDATQQEVQVLQRRATEVQTRSVALADMQARLTQKTEATAAAKAQLSLAQMRLEAEQEELKGDEERLRDMMEALRLARAQAAMRAYNVRLTEHNDDDAVRQRQTKSATDASALPPSTAAALPKQHAPSSSLRHTREHGDHRASAAIPSKVAAVTAAKPTTIATLATKKHRHRSDPDRLPNQILQELSEQLRLLPPGSQGTFVPATAWMEGQQALPAARHPRTRSYKRSSRHASTHDKESRLRAPPALPPPLSPSPHTARRGSHVPSARETPRDTASAHSQQQRQQRVRRAERQSVPQHPHDPPQRRHVDPSSLSGTFDSSPRQLTGDEEQEWSPSANTFTNLVDFSDADTTSQSIR